LKSGYLAGLRDRIGWREDAPIATWLVPLLIIVGHLHRRARCPLQVPAVMIDLLAIDWATEVHWIEAVRREADERRLAAICARGPAHFCAASSFLAVSPAIAAPGVY
jgi:hypothetical protein